MIASTPVEALQHAAAGNIIDTPDAYLVDVRCILLALDDAGWRLERRTPDTPSFREWQTLAGKRRDAGDDEPIIGLDVADQEQIALAQKWAER